MTKTETLQKLLKIRYLATAETVAQDLGVSQDVAVYFLGRNQSKGLLHRKNNHFWPQKRLIDLWLKEGLL